MTKLSYRLFILVVGCADLVPNKPEEKIEEDLVSVDVALEHIGQSYTLGCVEALKKRGEKNIYPWCRARGIKHQMSVKKILDTPISELNPEHIKGTKPSH